jgi:hypothetical protein
MSASHTFAITPEVAAVLAQSRINEDEVFLPAQLDRKMYMAVNKVLAECGGKWNKGRGAHVFPVGAVDTLKTAMDSGRVIRDKVIRQAFYTPDEVANRLVASLGIPDYEDRLEDNAENPVRILEPSAGDGALIRAVRKINRVSFIKAIEIDQVCCNHLQDSDPQGMLRIVCRDFLTYEPREDDRYDFIIMNPPFQRGQAFEHVHHALQFLKPAGKLGAILPSNFDADWLQPHSVNYWRLPAGTFKESGTNIETMMLVLTKSSRKEDVIVDRIEEIPMSPKTHSLAKGLFKAVREKSPPRPSSRKN